MKLWRFPDGCILYAIMKRGVSGQVDVASAHISTTYLAFRRLAPVIVESRALYMASEYIGGYWTPTYNLIIRI